MIQRRYIPTSQSWRLAERAGPSLALTGLGRLGWPTKISRLRPLPRVMWPVHINWSKHMNAQFGKPLKSVALLTNDRKVRGEAVISEKRLESRGSYVIASDLRQNHDLKIDLLPGWSVEKIASALSKPK